MAAEPYSPEALLPYFREKSWCQFLGGVPQGQVTDILWGSVYPSTIWRWYTRWMQEIEEREFQEARY